MPEQYVATDSQSGLQLTVTGAFPDDPDDRVRIARTATLFTRLFATILSTEEASERRKLFRAVETQLEIADALVHQDFEEVHRLIRETLAAMGVTEEHLREVEAELRRQQERLGDLGPPPEDGTDDG